MQSLDDYLWKPHISIPTKLKLYNTCILRIFLYGSECWSITKVDACRIDALDQWCLRTLLGTKWHQFVCSEGVRSITKQPNLTAIIQSWRLSTFGHIALWMMMQMPRWSPTDHQGVPVSRGWTPSSEIWEPTTWHWMKQSTWLRATLCGGWCLLTVLHTASGVFQKRKGRLSWQRMGV